MMMSVLDEHRSAEFSYFDSTLQPLLVRHFQACRHGSRFIDLEVEVEGVVFPCHQILLDAFCPYFAAHFSFHERQCEGGGLETGFAGRGAVGREVKRVTLTYNGLTVGGFSRLLEFMYTAELEVTADDVIDVLHCADFLQFHQVVCLCSTFLQQHITTDTCLQVYVLAEAHDLYDLADRAFTFILHNLEDVMKCQDFTQISQNLLVEIVSNDCLDVQTENVPLKAVLTWVQGDERKRGQLLPELVQHVRLRADCVCQLKNQLQQTSFRATEVVKDSLLKRLTSHLKESALPDRLTEAAVMVCRETQHKHRGKVIDLSCVYFFQPGALKWEVLTRLPFADRQDYSATVVSNILYLTGGQNMDVHDIHCTKIVFNENWAYNPLRDAWEERQMMRIPRYNHSSAVLHRKLYVIGGRSSLSSYSLRADGEVYDPTTDQWTFISPVRSIDGIANAAVASLDGKLYLSGGTYSTRSHHTHVPYDNYLGAQVYNPKEDVWQELLTLEHKITQSHVRVNRGCLLALDGFLLLLDDDIGRCHQLFNPVSQVLTDLMQAHGHHWFAGWTVLGGQLVCAGGVEDGRTGVTDMVHAWDLTVSQEDAANRQGWYMLPPLPCAVSHAACLNMYLSLPKLSPDRSAGSIVL